MYARTTPAVFSGRSASICPFSLSARARSSHVNISLPTTSVSSPTARWNNPRSSRIGVRISWKLYARNTSRAAASTKFHNADSGGRMSRVPRTALIVFGLSICRFKNIPSVARNPYPRQQCHYRAPSLRSGCKSHALFQVLLFVLQIILGITHDGLLRRRVVDLLPELSRDTHPQRVRLDHGTLRDHRPRPDDRAFADLRVIKDDAPHPDQVAVADGAALQRDLVCHGHVL